MEIEVIDVENNDSLKRVSQLEKEKEELLAELDYLKRKPVGRIGYVLLVLGFVFMFTSIYSSHRISAYIGIALIFWGAIALYISPSGYIKKSILDSIVKDPIEFMHKLASDLDYSGAPLYVSPGNLWGLSNSALIIPRQELDELPTDDWISDDRVFLENPPVMKLVPPGHTLSKLIEDELKTKYSAEELLDLSIDLKRVLVRGLEMVDSFQMTVEDSTIQVEMTGSVFFENFFDILELSQGKFIGDPLNSAIACILAKSTRKPVFIEDMSLDQNARTIRSTFKIVEEI